MSLKAARRRGIPAWASLEPVLYPDQSLKLMSMVADCCDVYRVGMLNHAAT